MRRAHKDTRMNSCGCGEGPIENAYVQGPEFCAMPPSQSIDPSSSAAPSLPAAGEFSQVGLFIVEFS